MSEPERSKSLVLVVGAGASKEVDLPVGAELKREIANVLDIRFRNGYERTGDDYIVNALHILVRSPDGRAGDINPLLEAARLIRDAMPQAMSIDNFIDSHRENERIALCGKLAIARCILAAEANSSLQFDRSNIYNKMNFSSLEPIWFNAFFQLLTESCQRQDLAARFQKVGVISFNYDRCIEHYLHSALQNYYRLKSEEAAEVLSALEVHHPYGKVGVLPWMDANAGIEFGAPPDAKQLIEVAGKLRTFTEGTDASTSDISVVRTSVATAERIAFLGFAFHRINLELLFPGPRSKGPPDMRPIYATALGISQSDAKLIAEDLAVMRNVLLERIHIRTDLTCSQLFQEYRRSLSLC
ncbi:MAG TPA: hypothetical protein VH988_26740 [Thermoanaerobaculia bacterium]|jgi:hypothetical protein|nr:hypothetical protein [Thermoanaerobaculia bacterium]